MKNLFDIKAKGGEAMKKVCELNIVCYSLILPAGASCTVTVSLRPS